VSPEQFRRVRDLFDQALEADPADVRAWLDQRAGDDPEVRREAAALLKLHSRAGSFLSAGVPERVPDLFPEDSALEAGTTVGIYTIEREVGRGGFGRVYRAKDQRLGRTVALKALAPRLLRDPSHRERLRREARAAAALTHPGICTVYAFEEIDDDLYIVSEYIEGRTLRDEITNGPRPSPGEVLETARELAAALASAHAKGITHRDLKPENVMRAVDGRLKVLDFGLARFDEVLEETRAYVTQPGTLVGTPEYMAPEQLNGERADARADVFTFGVLIYEYACGAHPFAASTPMGVAARILAGQAASIGACAPSLAPSVVGVVERSLQKSPAARFGSAAEIVAALDRHPEVAAPRPIVTAWWRRHQLIVIALYLIASILGWQIKEWQHAYADPVFLLLGVAATVGGIFRGFLLFTEQVNRENFERERRRVYPIALAIDLIIALSLGVDGAIISTTRPLAALLTFALAAGLVVTSAVLEPATTTAAFREGGGN
jgi:tRNA A-37 threonylcarbamoyl transferase component Bud32